MPRYETLPPNNFLGLDEKHSSYEHSAALILPIPYEGTVSYGQGTREGPRAIILASTRRITPSRSKPPASWPSAAMKTTWKS